MLTVNGVCVTLLWGGYADTGHHDGVEKGGGGGQGEGLGPNAR